MALIASAFEHTSNRVPSFALIASVFFAAIGLVSWRKTPTHLRSKRAIRGVATAWTGLFCVLAFARLSPHGASRPHAAPVDLTPIGHGPPPPHPPVFVAVPINPAGQLPPMQPDHGLATISTIPRSFCTIAGHRLETPIDRLELTAGHYRVQCRDEVTRRHGIFDVTVMAGTETRDTGRALGL